jgi:hypothetical protein
VPTHACMHSVSADVERSQSVSIMFSHASGSIIIRHRTLTCAARHQGLDPRQHARCHAHRREGLEPALLRQLGVFISGCSYQDGGGVRGGDDAMTADGIDASERSHIQPRPTASSSDQSEQAQQAGAATDQEQPETNEDTAQLCVEAEHGMHAWDPNSQPASQPASGQLTSASSRCRRWHIRAAAAQLAAPPCPPSDLSDEKAGAGGGDGGLPR